MSDIRSALEEAFKEDTLEVKETESTAVETENPEPEQSGRLRDESGKFAAKETPQETPQEPAPEIPQKRAPSSWKKEAQEIYLKADRGEALTPEEIKTLTAEAERRENDFHKGLSEFQGHSQRAKAYDQAIAPYQSHLQSLGVDAPTAISALMRADYTLRTSDPQTKAQYFQSLAREYGIDLNGLSNPQPVDPNTQYLMQQMNTLRQQQQMWQNQVAEQEKTRVSQEIQSFATPERQHFNAVRNEMADLLETGKANNLQEAYEMAVWMKPEIRQSLIEQQRQDAQRKAAETFHAQRAKTAAVSVKGSSPTSAGGQTPQGSLRDILAAQFADN